MRRAANIFSNHSWHSESFEKDLSRAEQSLLARKSAAVALKKLDVEGAVGSSESGAPTWPEGIVGSLSHGGGEALAVVDKSSNVKSLGVDVEYVMPLERAKKVSHKIVTENELKLIEQSAYSFEELFTVFFSAKESIYKCFEPLLNKFIAFHEVELLNWDFIEGSFSFEFEGGRGTGRYEILDGKVRTLVITL